MNQAYQLNAAAGTIAVAEEIGNAIKQIFKNNFTYRYSLASNIVDTKADLYICFANRVAELAQYISKDKIIGIEMIPTPQFFIDIATLPPEEQRWVFCNTRRSAQTIINYCSDNGLPIDRFNYATYEDTPEDELASCLRQAEFIVGVTPIVSPGQILYKKYGKYLQPKVRIIPVDRILSPKSIALINDWLEERRLEYFVELNYENTHDSLTGLYNRRFFTETFSRYDSEARLPLAVVVMDLDGLKAINDKFGHSQGDLLLQESAEILKKYFPAESIVARIGGDEFAAIMQRTSELEVRRVIKSIRRKFNDLEKQELRNGVNISIGYAMAAEDGRELSEVFNAADTAMYRDKKAHQE